jgi:hypothetical protein
MVFLATCDSPFSLNDLAARIRKSSNFRFNWQFYQCMGVGPQWPPSIRQALDAIIATPELHAFLQESFEPMYAEAFEIKPLHEHCRVDAAAGEFEKILAGAAGDHLGAYSQILRDATADEKQAIKELFESPGRYRAYELLSGNVPGCPACRDRYNYLFSNWFYGVAWDRCFLALWPRRNLLWVGCLTDTD